MFGLDLAQRELRGRARRARDRLDLVPRHRRDDGGPAADLAGEGHPARIRRPGHDARRLGRLLPRPRAARVDAVARDDLARDLRAARDPGRDPRRRRSRRLWGDIWPLLVIGAVAIPLGLEIFSRGEIYAKRHGLLKRSG